MNADEFRNGIRDYLEHHPTDLLMTIPPGSGICRIANVPMANWEEGFASSKPGRWTLGGRPSRYFADDVEACAAELGYFTDKPIGADVVLELWETTRPFHVASIYQLPQPFQDELFAEKSQSIVKWVKSHIFIEELQRSAGYSSVDFIQAPSASGIVCKIGGTCLVTPDSDAVQFIACHSYKDWVDSHY